MFDGVPVVENDLYGHRSCLNHVLCEFDHICEDMSQMNMLSFQIFTWEKRERALLIEHGFLIGTIR